MAFNAKDGSRHHSASRAKLHDDMAADADVKTKKPKSNNPHDMPQEDADKNVSHMDMHEVVSKHGPATHIHSHHDDEGNVHTVTTHHAEGHHHHSEHPSREAAFDHVKMAHGMDGGMDNEETPNSDEETPDDAYSAAVPTGGGIPGLA